MQIYFIPCRVLWGSWAQSLFMSPIFLIIGNNLLFSLQDLPWVSVGRFSCQLGDWGEWRSGRKKQPWDKVPFPHQRKPTTSLSYLWILKPLQVGKGYGHAAHKQEDPRSVKPEGWQCWLLLTSPQIHQKNVHKLITPSFTIKPVIIFPKLRHMVWGYLSCYLHFAWQSNKATLFLLPANSVSEIWFVLVYTEAELSASILSLWKSGGLGRYF